MSNDIDKSVNRLNAAETILRQAIALQNHISEARSPASKPSAAARTSRSATRTPWPPSKHPRHSNRRT